MLPVATPACMCLLRVVGRLSKDVQGLVHAALPAQRARAGPGLDPGPTPRRLDQPHRHVDRALQFARKVEAGGGEIAHRIRRCRCPGSAVVEGLLCLHGGVLRYGEQPDPWHRGCGNLAGCVERAPHRQFHVRLARAQPHVADQHVARRLPARSVVYLQRVGTASGDRVQHRLPAACGVRPAAHRLPRKRHGNRLPRACVSPDRNGPVTLQDGVIPEQRMQQSRRLPRRGRHRHYCRSHHQQHTPDRSEPAHRPSPGANGNCNAW